VIVDALAYLLTYLLTTFWSVQRQVTGGD